MGKFFKSLATAVQNPAVQAQLAAAAVALVAAFGFHVPAGDVATVVAVTAALLATWLHLPSVRALQASVTRPKNTGE